MRIPGSVSALLELRLGEAGVDALGVAAHVPHYLAQATYPAASLTLLEHLERLTGLHLPTETAARGRPGQPHRDRRADRPLRENTAVVAALEQQYDSFTAAREGTDLLDAAGEVPSAEEIGAEFERFLADQDRKRPRRANGRPVRERISREVGRGGRRRRRTGRRTPRPAPGRRPS